MNTPDLSSMVHSMSGNMYIITFKSCNVIAVWGPCFLQVVPAIYLICFVRVILAVCLVMLSLLVVMPCQFVCYIICCCVMTILFVLYCLNVDLDKRFKIACSR